MKVVFVGTRKADFTTRGIVTGYPYYVQPGVPLVMDDHDAKSLLETDDRWKQAEPEKAPIKDKK